MKHHALTLAAVTATAASLPLNLPAVASGSPGLVQLAVSLVVAALWLAVMLTCADHPAPVAITAGYLALTLLLMAAGLLAPFRALPVANLAWMLAVAPFAGFAVISPGPSEALATAALFCLMVMLLGALMRRRARQRPADLEVFGTGRQLPDQPEHPEIDRMVFRKAGRIRPKKQ